MVQERSLEIGQTLFAGIKEFDSPGIRIREVLKHLGPKLGQTSFGSDDFETASPIGEENRKALMRWMLSLPGDEGYQLFRESDNLRQISDDAATHKALETMYVGPRPEADEDRFLWARLFIENIHNSMAVRNRLRIVEGEFNEFMDRAISGEMRGVNVLSIAAGSSRGIMEVFASLNGVVDPNLVRLRMIDLNREALDDGRKLAEDLNIHESVDFVRAHFLGFRRYLEEGYKPDFVEVVGLLDYLPVKSIKELLSALSNSLADDGVVLYSNVAPNDERDFTHKVVGWPNMYYRDSETLMGLAKNAGFNTDRTTVMSEPLGVYNLVLARK